MQLGRVDGIIVNPASTNEIYATDAWGGLWKTSPILQPALSLPKGEGRGEV